MQRLLVRSKAKGTIRGYTSSIKSWLKYAAENDLPTNPATTFGVTRYITMLADSNVGFSALAVVSPALMLLHECQNHNIAAAIQAPFVKLILTGAKREAAERRGPVKKAPVLSQSQIHQVVDLLWKKGVGVLDKSISLATWRTIVRIYTMYKTLCRHDCFAQLLTQDIILGEDYVQLSFARSKNDQYYDGSITILASLPEQPQYCPKVIFATYFQAMSFKQTGMEFLNCRLQFTKKFGVQALPHLSLAYSTSLVESRKLCHDLGFEGNFSEKSYKVAGVTQGFDAGLSSEEMRNHGRWKSLETPNLYYAQNKKMKMKISLKIV